MNDPRKSLDKKQTYVDVTGLVQDTRTTPLVVDNLGLSKMEELYSQEEWVNLEPAEISTVDREIATLKRISEELDSLVQRIEDHAKNYDAPITDIDILENFIDFLKQRGLAGEIPRVTNWFCDTDDGVELNNYFSNFLEKIRVIDGRILAKKRTQLATEFKACLDRLTKLI